MGGPGAPSGLQMQGRQAGQMHLCLLPFSGPCPSLSWCGCCSCSGRALQGPHRPNRSSLGDICYHQGPGGRPEQAGVEVPVGGVGAGHSGEVEGLLRQQGPGGRVAGPEPGASAAGLLSGGCMWAGWGSSHRPRSPGEAPRGLDRQRGGRPAHTWSPWSIKAETHSKVGWSVAGDPEGCTVLEAEVCAGVWGGGLSRLALPLPLPLPSPYCFKGNRKLLGPQGAGTIWGAAR